MIWDLYTGQLKFGALKGHTSWVRSIAFSPAGRVLASGSQDKTIRMWDTETGSAVLGPLTGHTDYINSITFSHDERLLISGSWDKIIRIWDACTGEPTGRLIRAHSLVYSVVISTDDTKILAALYDKTVKAYDLATGAVIFEGVGHESGVNSAAFSPDNCYFASASVDHTVRIWDGKTGRVMCGPLTGHIQPVQAVAFSPDGKYIASGSWDTTIRIWDADTGAMRIGPFDAHTDVIGGIAFTPDGTRLISGSNDRTIKVWDISDLGIQANTLNTPISIAAQSIEAEIANTTTPAEIVSLLSVRGCANMTDQLDITTCGDYPISSGGFGDIYRCQLKNETEVAVKTIRFYVGSDQQNQKHLKYAARELYTWSQCRHPNVQRLLGLAMFRNQIGMVAKWQSKGSLPQYLERHAEADRCIMITQIAEGLSYLHVCGVIHGDLKGANILMSNSGVVQLADFGSARLQEYTLKFMKSSTKETLSPRWTAPELFKGAKSNAKTDIYALGMTILETMTGDVPFPDKADHAVMFAVMFEKARPERPETQIPKDSEHGDTLWSLLNSCWEFEPEGRPGAAEVKMILKGITQDGLKHK